MWFRNGLFSLITVTAFFIGCEAILAFAGIQPTLSNEDPFVGFAENVPLFVEDDHPDGQSVVSTARNKLRLFNYQSFPKDKSDQAYRIFCMGGSTTFGRPYDDPVSFCGWLRAYLEAADPARNWEVINAGGVSYASYRVAKLMKELVQYQPDLFIVYSGQNEFLEHRSYGSLLDLPVWLVNLNAWLSGTRIYTAMSKAITLARQGSPEQARERYSLAGEVDTILAHTAGPQSYHRDDVMKGRIMKHFHLNLERMVRIARQANADIVFVMPAINLRDMSPFKSEHEKDLNEQALGSWQMYYDQAMQLEYAGNAAEALVAYRQAMAIDGRYAELHYRMGKAHFSLGEYDQAERSFRQAVEEDVAPLRILEGMQRSIAEVADRAEVPVIDFTAILRAAYQDQYDHTVFGSEYFVDHVHTSMEGYRLLGLALFDELVRQGIASPDAAWGAQRQAAVRQQVIDELDAGDEGHALVKLARVFSWAGKFSEAHRLFLQGMKILGPSPELLDQLARTAYFLGDYDSVIRHLEDSLRYFPAYTGVHARLAAVRAELGELDLAIGHCKAELILDPGNDKVTMLLGELFEEQGDISAARREYERLLQRSADYMPARLRLSELLIRQGLHDEALPHVRMVLQEEPELDRVHNALGLIFLRRGDTDRAIHHFSEVLRLSPDHTDARERLRQLKSVRMRQAGQSASSRS